MNKFFRSLVIAAVFAVATLAFAPASYAQSCNGGLCNGVSWTVVYVNNSGSGACFSFSATITYSGGGTCTESSPACAQCAQTCSPNTQCQFTQNWGATGGTCTPPSAGETVTFRVVNCNIGLPGCLTAAVTCT